MVENVISYKGYLGSLQIGLEDNCLYGRVLNIGDLVTFEGCTVEEARRAFEESVEHYLGICRELETEAAGARRRREAPGGGD